MGRNILDTFACAGAAAWGYWKAGLNPYGVELDPKRALHYPFPVHVGDALEAIRTLNQGGKVGFVLPEGRRPIRVRGKIVGTQGRVVWLGKSDFIAGHGSPPCQGYTRGNAGKVTDWPKLIPDVRELFQAGGWVYVIENVDDAINEMVNPARLCGCMFDLKAQDYTCLEPGKHIGTCDIANGVTVHLQRGRLFETSFELDPPRACDHTNHEWVAGAYGGARRDKHEAKYVRKGGYVPPTKELVAELLGIEHDMTWAELFEAIPPAYTEYIGGYLREVSSVQS